MDKRIAKAVDGHVANARTVVWMRPCRATLQWRGLKLEYSVDSPNSTRHRTLKPMPEKPNAPVNTLVEKGWAEKSKAGKQPTHYAALVEPDAVRERQLDHFMDRVAQGSVVPLVAHLVQGTSLTRNELSELKKLIRDAERRHDASAIDTKNDHSQTGKKAGEN